MLDILTSGYTDMIMVGKKCLLFTGFLEHIDITDSVKEVKMAGNKFVIELKSGTVVKLATDEGPILLFLCQFMDD